MRKAKKIAIAYDFDGTLSPDYMQHSSFLPHIGIRQPFKDFWPKVKNHAKNENMDEILAYMHLMLHEATYKRISIKRESFVEHGKAIEFFPGVTSWFKRINKYAKKRGILIEHYIISSGLREMIEGCRIKSEFKYICASGFMYNSDGVAIWPALAVNYTNKTQYLFRINKGIHNCWDNAGVNKFISLSEREIPFENIIYIGDGETDIPAMKMTKYMHGKAISVYNPRKRGLKKKSDLLVKQERADHSVKADYRANGDIDKIIKAFITKIASS